MVANIIESGIIDKMITNEGKSVNDYGDDPVMLVFLRQFGCVFCRESLVEISKKRKNIENLGTKIVFIHMSENKLAEQYFEKYKLPNAIHVSDPTQEFYKAFGLLKGSFAQLFGLQTWVRGFQAGVQNGVLPQKQIGDGFQMPGVFIYHENKIKEHFIHQRISEKPNYLDMIKCCTT